MKWRSGIESGIRLLLLASDAFWSRVDNVFFPRFEYVQYQTVVSQKFIL